MLLRFIIYLIVEWVVAHFFVAVGHSPIIGVWVVARFL